MTGAEIGTVVASLGALITAAVTYRKTAAEARRTQSDIGLTNVTAASDVVALLREELDRVNTALTAQRSVGDTLKGTITQHEQQIRILETRIRRLEGFLAELGYNPDDINGPEGVPI